MNPTFLEVFQSFILPALTVLGGLTALIIFLLSAPKRKVENKKIVHETDQMIQMTAATLHKMTTEAAAQALKAQKDLIDSLREDTASFRMEIKQVRQEQADMKCKLDERDLQIVQLEIKVERLEHELGVREENIENLKQKLQEYKEDNQRYKQENEDLKRQIEAQNERIKELETELAEIRKLYQEHAK